jgi:hypothetical protein
MFIKLNPDERLLVVSGATHYKLFGPGWVCLMPWQKALTRLYVGPQGQPFQFDEVRTIEDIPVNVTTQVLYQVGPELIRDDLLPKLPWLNEEEGWKRILKWRTEHILRQLLTNYSWRELSRPAIQERLERQLTQTLAEYLKIMGLKIMSVCLVKIELPVNLQRTIVQTERDGIEPRGRAMVLKEYFDIFGHDLAQAMPYIVQWEWLNVMRKKDGQHVVLADLALSPDKRPSDAGPAQPLFQMQLPLPQQS